MNHVVAFTTIWLASCLYALVRGGAAERLGAILLLAAPVASVLAQDTSPNAFAGVDIGLWIADGLLFLALTALAIVANRFWPIWLAAMQLVTVLAHVAPVLQPDLLPWAYWRAIALWSYPMQLVLLVATIRHRQRLDQFGSDPSWKSALAFI